MPMTAMRAGDVIVAVQRLGHAQRNRLFSDVKMCQSRHQRPRVEVVDLGFEHPDGQHLAIHSDPEIHLFRDFRGAGGGAHSETPDMRASTSKTTAKSSFSQP